MSLSNSEKQAVIDYLDNLDDSIKAIVLATLEAFAEWLSQNLYNIYIKIKDGLLALWRFVVSCFN
jgi:hypothetical protein